MDYLAGEGFFEGETVLMQAGNSEHFKAQHCTQEGFLPIDRYQQLIQEADLVICHGGAGTLIHVFQAGKVPVVMPRRRKYGEIIDDHQLELLEVLASEGRVILAHEPDELCGAVVEAKRRRGQQGPRPPTRMLALVAEAIEKLSGQKA